MGYPNAVPAFTTKNAGDTIQPSHINDLQTEVAAVENALLSTGLAHNVKFATDATYDIGSATLRARDIYASRRVAVGSTTFANFPASTIAGALMRRSDGSRGLWMDAGGQWVGVSGEAVNIKDFGAISTGTSTDATTNDNAFSSAISVVASGGEILVPPGNYYISHAISFGSKNLTLRGAGPGVSMITLSSNASTNMVEIGDAATYNTGARVCGLRLDGNSTNQSSGHGIVCKGGTIDITIDDVYIKSAKQNGILVKGTGVASSNAAGAWILHSKIENSGSHNIFFDQYFVASRVADCDISGTRDSGTFHGIAANAGSDLEIVGNNIWEVGADGVNLVGCSWVTVAGNFIHTTPRDGIRCSSGHSNVITGNAIYHPSYNHAATNNGISLFNETHTVVVGNAIEPNSTATVDSGIKETLSADFNSIVGNTLKGSTVFIGAPITTVGAATRVAENPGYVNLKRGASSCADGGTITHGLFTAPTRVSVTSQVAGEFASVTAISATTFTVALKKHDGTAGTNSTVYWEASF